MLVTVDGLTIEGGEASRSYLEALAKGSVEPTTTALFRRAVQEGMVVVDVGAFLGQYSLLAAQAVGPAGKVVAFEPDPRNFAFLVKNVERNRFSDRVETVPQAVTDRTGVITLYLDPEVGSGSSVVFRRRRVVATETVPTVRLDDALGHSISPDVIKLDIEGGEVRALDGMAETIRGAKSDLAMFIECFPKALRTAGAGVHALVQRLERLGFWVYVIDEGLRRLFPITTRRSSLWSFYVYLGLHSLLVVNESTIQEAARLAAEAARPQTDHRGSEEYKRHVVSTYVVRALQAAAGAEPIDVRRRRFENVEALV